MTIYLNSTSYSHRFLCQEELERDPSWIPEEASTFVLAPRFGPLVTASQITASHEAGIPAKNKLGSESVEGAGRLQ